MECKVKKKKLDGLTVVISVDGGTVIVNGRPSLAGFRIYNTCRFGKTSEGALNSKPPN